MDWDRLAKHLEECHTNAENKKAKDYETKLEELDPKNISDTYLKNIKKASNKIITEGGQAEEIRLYSRGLKPREGLVIDTTLDQLRNLWNYYRYRINNEYSTQTSKKWIRSQIIILLVSEDDYHFINKVKKENGDLRQHANVPKKSCHSLEHLVFPTYGWFHKPTVQAPIELLFELKNGTKEDIMPEYLL